MTEKAKIKLSFVDDNKITRTGSKSFTVKQGKEVDLILHTDLTGGPTVSFAVTVADAGGNKYFIDGAQQATLTLIRGRTYKFNLNGTVSGHPFWIQTTDNGNEYDSGNVITAGISRNGANSGTISYTVPHDAPSTLYYRCQFHGGMGGQINIVSV